MKSKISVLEGAERCCKFKDLDDGDYFLYSGILYKKVTESHLAPDDRHAFNWAISFNAISMKDCTVVLLEKETIVKLVDIDIRYRFR